MRRLARALSILLCGILLLGLTGPSVQAATAAIKVSKTSVAMNPGKTFQLTASGSSLKNKTLVWSSTNSKVVTVSKKGKLTAVKAGTATVTVSIKGTKRSASCKVSVYAYLRGIQLYSADVVNLKIGDTSTIRAVTIPTRVRNKAFSYQTEDKAVATVSQTGIITAIVAGTTKIQVSTVGKTKAGEKVTKEITVVVAAATDDSDSGSTSTGGGGGTTTPTSPVLSGPEVSGQLTTYTLNRNYTATVHFSVTVGGVSFSRDSTVCNILNMFANMTGTFDNSAGTIRVERLSGTEWWTVYQLPAKKALCQIKAIEQAAGNSNAGQLIIKTVSETPIIVIQ